MALQECNNSFHPVGIGQPKSRPSALQVLVTLNVETNRKLGGDAEQEASKRIWRYETASSPSCLDTIWFFSAISMSFNTVESND